jgi:hypothetical protein
LFIPACKTRMGPFDADIQSQVEMPIELVGFLLTTSGDAFFALSWFSVKWKIGAVSLATRSNRIWLGIVV